MKICRMCWEICTYDDEWCDGVKVERHEKCYEFFENPKDMINHLVNKKSKSALKLQELVIDMENQTGRALVDVQNWLSKEGKLSTEVTNKVLRDLLEESRKTDKERGSA